MINNSAPEHLKDPGLRQGIPSTPAVIRARGLTKTYQMGEVMIQALRGVDLTLFRGEFVVMLGASGSGKSTLLNILGGLDQPSQGELYFGEQCLSQASERVLTRYRRDHIGFVFQFYNLIPSLTARENVAMVTDISAHPMSAENALALVGLENRVDHFPAQMSGGEQQRVAIARAVAKRPDILLCDEPTGALDSQTGVRVLAALESANKEMGSTTVVITHNEGIAAMADRVLRLKDGAIVDEQRNVNKVFASALNW